MGKWKKKQEKDPKVEEAKARAKAELADVEMEIDSARKLAMTKRFDLQGRIGAAQKVLGALGSAMLKDPPQWEYEKHETACRELVEQVGIACESIGDAAGGLIDLGAERRELEKRHTKLSNAAEFGGRLPLYEEDSPYQCDLCSDCNVDPQDCEDEGIEPKSEECTKARAAAGIDAEEPAERDALMCADCALEPTTCGHKYASEACQKAMDEAGEKADAKLDQGAERLTEQGKCPASCDHITMTGGCAKDLTPGTVACKAMRTEPAERPVVRVVHTSDQCVSCPKIWICPHDVALGDRDCRLQRGELVATRCTACNVEFDPSTRPAADPDGKLCEKCFASARGLDALGARKIKKGRKS